MPSGIGFKVEIDLDDTATTPNYVAICPESVDYNMNENDDTYTLLCDGGESRTETTSIDRECSVTFVYDSGNTAHVYLKDKMDKGLAATNGRKVTGCKITDNLDGVVTEWVNANVSQFTSTRSADEVTRISCVIKPLGTVTIT